MEDQYGRPLKVYCILNTKTGLLINGRSRMKVWDNPRSPAREITYFRLSGRPDVPFLVVAEFELVETKESRSRRNAGN